MTAIENDPQTVDLDAIVPESTELAIEGIPCTVRRLKAKEFFALLRVLTNGMGSGISRVDFSGPEDEVQGQFIGLFLAAVPNATEEFVDFLKIVVDPKDSQQTGALNKAMENPELETVMDVLTVVAEQEAPDLKQLLGKGRAALKRIQSLAPKTGS